VFPALPVSRAAAKPDRTGIGSCWSLSPWAPRARAEPDGAGADGDGGCSAFEVVHILEKAREPVEDVAVVKYCSAAAKLGRTVAISHDFELVETL